MNLLGIDRGGSGGFYSDLFSHETAPLQPNDADVPDAGAGFDAHQRNVSLDFIRGLMMVSMLFVDVCGDHLSFLSHAKWNGLPFADFIMPGFLFALGGSLSISTSRRQQCTKHQRFMKSIRRCTRLFVLGIMLQGPWIPIASKAKYTLGIDLDRFRVMGILQRIALCLLILQVIVVYFKPITWQALIVLTLLAVHTVISLLVAPQDCVEDSAFSIECNAQSYIDRLVLGRAHLYSPEDGYDPEGILGTLACVFTCFIGFLSFHPIMVGTKRKLLISSILTAGGLICNYVGFPLNKALWTLSYNLITAAACLACIAGLRSLSAVYFKNNPVTKLGANAIVFFILSDCGGVAAAIINSFWVVRDGRRVTLLSILQEDVLRVHEYPYMILVYAFMQLVLMMWLTNTLYRRGLLLTI